MTTQSTLTRNESAQAALEAAVRDSLRFPAPREISVAARDNHSGEPAFYVSVTMPSEAEIPDVATQNRVIGEMIAALERIGDDRFPYLYFGPREDGGDGEADESFGTDEDVG